jgi:hypothetical protein
MAARKKYVVVGEKVYPRRDKTPSFEYINNDTKDIFDIWRTSRPWKLAENADPTPPKLFATRSEAVQFKNRANAEQKDQYYGIYKEFITKFKVLDEATFATIYTKYDQNQRITLTE